MQLNLKKPIAFFDLETTGINISEDRVLEIAIIKVNPDGSEETKAMRINPTIPIPLESSLIHGIYEDDIKDALTFKEAAKDLSNFIKGCDLGGYNLIKFDIPVLAEEFLRADVDFTLENRKVVDAQRIFFMMEPRTLTAAYKFYCKKKLEGAHGALADTKATLDVFKAQLDHYEGEKIEDKDGNLIEPVVNDMNKIHELTAGKFADLSGRLGFNDKGIVVFNFGKHKNKPVAEIFKLEPGYYEWMMRGDFPQYTKNILTKIKLGIFKG